MQSYVYRAQIFFNSSVRELHLLEEPYLTKKKYQLSAGLEPATSGLSYFSSALLLMAPIGGRARTPSSTYRFWLHLVPEMSQGASPGTLPPQAAPLSITPWLSGMTYHCPTTPASLGKPHLDNCVHFQLVLHQLSILYEKNLYCCTSLRDLSKDTLLKEIEKESLEEYKPFTWRDLNLRWGVHSTAVLQQNHC